MAEADGSALQPDAGPEFEVFQARAVAVGDAELRTETLAEALVVVLFVGEAEGETEAGGALAVVRAGDPPARPSSSGSAQRVMERQLGGLRRSITQRSRASLEREPSSEKIVRTLSARSRSTGSSTHSSELWHSSSSSRGSESNGSSHGRTHAPASQKDPGDR